MQSASPNNRGSFAGTSIGLITNFLFGRHLVRAGNCLLWIKVLLPAEVGPLIIKSICDSLESMGNRRPEQLAADRSTANGAGRLQFKFRTLVQIFPKQRFGTKNPRALRKKKFATL